MTNTPDAFVVAGVSVTSLPVVAMAVIPTIGPPRLLVTTPVIVPAGPVGGAVVE
jgi:hypothetical protein